MAAWISQNLFYFIIQSGLDQGLLSERNIGEVYVVGRPAHAHYSLNARSKIFASGIQLKNMLKTNFLNVSYWGRTYFVHASIDLIVKSRTYSCSMYDLASCFLLFCSRFYLIISLLFGLSMTSDILSYLLILCESSYENSFSGDFASNWLVKILRSLYFSVEKHLPG